MKRKKKGKKPKDIQSMIDGGPLCHQVKDLKTALRSKTIPCKRRKKGKVGGKME